MEEHHEVAACPFPNFGKLVENLENMLQLLQALSVTVLSLVQAKGNKDDRSAQAVQDEASLLPAATRAGFSMAPRPQVGNVHSRHSVAATIRPPEVRMTAITREWLSWDDYFGKVREGRDLSEEILTNVVCSGIY